VAAATAETEREGGREGGRVTLIDVRTKK
jgi:hypothetical protein